MRLVCPLVGPQWILVSYTAEDGGVAGPTAPSTIQFDGSVVSGNTGCNGFSGGYTSTGDSLTIGDLAVTQMYCEATSAQEPAILAGLGDVVAYRTDTGDLELLDAQGNSQLVYRTLEGTHMGAGVRGRHAGPRGSGDAGVRQRHRVRPGTLQRVLGVRDGRRLKPHGRAHRGLQGSVPGPGEFEGQLFAALEAARSWSIEAGDLVLLG